MADAFADALDGLDEIPWSELQVAYGSATQVPGILRRLASASQVDVDRGWVQINKQILLHQGTVWPGTVPAIRFLVRIAAAPKTLRRPRLVGYLAHLSLGGDEPYAPAGAAKAVRTAVRVDLPAMHGLLRTGEPALGLAVAELAAALPFDLPAAGPTVDCLFATETEPAALRALAGSKAMLGDWSVAVQTLLQQAENASSYRAIRLPSELVIRPWGVPPGTQTHQGEPLEDVVGFPVYSTVRSWLAETTPGVEDDSFFRAARFVLDLFSEVGPRTWSAP